MKRELVQRKQIVTLENNFIRLEFNLGTGLFNLCESHGSKKVISSAFSSLNIEIEGNKKFIPTFNYKSNPSCEKKEIVDRLGKGKALSFTFSGSDKPDLTVCLTLYKNQPYLVIQSSIYNSLNREIRIVDFQPFCLLPKKGGKLELGSNPAKWTFYKNGWQGHSPSYLLHLNEKESPLSDNYENKHLINLGILGDPDIKVPDKPGDFSSELMTTIYDIDTDNSIVIGFISAERQFSQIRFRAQNLKKNQIELIAISNAEGLTLNPNDSMMSEKLFIDFCSPGLKALDNYSLAVKKEMKVDIKESIPTGWCSWYYYYGGITEKEIIQNIEAMSKHQKEILLEVVLIDEGWENDWGDWEANEKFSHGMKWLTEKIEKEGLIPGLWLAPFTVSKDSHLYRKHPDWVIKDNNEKPIQVCEWRSHIIYGLDCSHPEAQKWLKELFQKVTQNWGYKYVKLDFIFGSAIIEKYYNSDMTSAQVYRRGLKIIKDAVGEHVFIAGCGSPVGPSIGLMDTMRISTDSTAKWESKDKYWASIRNVTRNTINRYFMHRNFWINDPDALLVREDKTELTLDEIHTLATVIGLSGSMVISGDSQVTLSPRRRDIISKLLPIYGKSAVPVDFFEHETPQIFNLRVKKEFGSWNVAGIFNWEDKERNFLLKLNRLNLDSNKKYHIYNFWKEEYLGIFSKEIKFPKMKPHSCKLLSIREVEDHPQLISTTFHITQGGMEISEFDYDKSKRQLRCSLIFQGKGVEKGSIFIYVPSGLLVKEVISENSKLSYKVSGKNLLGITLFIKNRIGLHINFRRDNKD